MYFTRRDEASSRALFAVDTSTGRVTKSRLHIPLVRPVAVATGPQGLQYILDSREQEYVVYAVRHDGSVVWSSTLELGTGVATDLTVARNRLYVTTPGELRVYEPRGGPAISVVRGETSPFNNAWSVALDDRGHVFVAELSGFLIEELADDGRLIRTYQLHDKPVDLAYRDGWLAVGCVDRNLFLNTKTGTIRRTLVRGEDPQHSTGTLAYTSDDRLAMLQSGELRVYSVKYR